jgi:hypothetical protein
MRRRLGDGRRWVDPVRPRHLAAGPGVLALAPISDARVGEPAGVNSAISSFGLSVGLAVTGAVLLAAIATLFSARSDAGTVLAPAEKDQVAKVLEHDTFRRSVAHRLAYSPPLTGDMAVHSPG